MILIVLEKIFVVLLILGMIFEIFLICVMLARIFVVLGVCPGCLFEQSNESAIQRGQPKQRKSPHGRWRCIGSAESPELIREER